MLFPNDILEVVGDDESIERFSQRMNSEVQPMLQEDADMMELQCMKVGENSQLKGMLIRESGIRNEYRCLVVGFEDARGNMHVAGADHKITVGEKLWFAGSREQLSRLNTLLHP